MWRSVWDFIRPTKAELLVHFVPLFTTLIISVSFSMLLRFHFGWSEDDSIEAMFACMIPLLTGSYIYMRYRLRNELNKREGRNA